MLIYANSFWVHLDPVTPDRLEHAVHKWLTGKVSDTPVLKTLLQAGSITNSLGWSVEASRAGELPQQDEIRGVFMLSHPDDKIADRQWNLRIGYRHLIQGKNSHVSVALETDETVMSSEKTPVVTRPGVVADIVKACGLLDDFPGSGVTPLSIENVPRVQSELFMNRWHAVVLVSPKSSTGRPMVNPLALADQLLGLANVYVIKNSEETFPIRDKLGRDLSVVDGAIRIIFPPNSSKECVSRLLTPWEISQKTQSRGRRAVSLERWLLFLVTTALSKTHLMGEIRAEHVSHFATEIEIKRLQQLGDSSAAALTEQLRAQKERIGQLEKEVAEVKKEREEYNSEWDKANNEVARLNAEVQNRDKIRGRLIREGKLKDNDFIPVSDLEDAVEKCRNHYEGKLIFAPNKASKLSENRFEALSEFETALTWLAGAFRDSRLKPGSMDFRKLELRLKEQLPDWFYEPHQSSSAKSGKSAKDYQCTYDGLTYDLDDHIGTGKSRREEETIRMCFAWCPKHKAVIIGYIGQHPRNTKT
jgi:hypothetical protein